MSDLLVSIDLGTTRLKVAAYRPDGTLAHQVVRRHREMAGTGDGGEIHRWQSAVAWWEDTVQATAELLAALPDDVVRGIGLSGRGGAAVFADETGEVIADPWSDGRHRDQARSLASWRKDGVWLSNYGLQLIAKYLWLRERRPEQARRISRAFYAKDWLLYRLTGVHVTDWTSGPDAPGWDPALDHWQLPGDLLPRPALPWTLAGSMCADAAARLGLDESVPVAVGAHDGLAANIGAGAIQPGDCALTLGTHGVVRMVTASQPEGAYRFYGFPPDRHIIGGNAVLAGRCADWVLELLGAPAEPAADYAALEQAAAAVPAGAGGVRFLPFLAGRVSPEIRPGARALFAGLELSHGRGELYRAVLEGTAFAMTDIFDQVRGWCGEPARVRATGGGSESPLWMELLAAMLDRPVGLGGAGVEGRGAVMCLAVALGWHPDLASAADAMVRVVQTVDPEPGLVAHYRVIREDWQALNRLSRQFDRPR